MQVRRAITVIITAVWALLASYLIFFILFSSGHTGLPSVPFPYPAPCSQNLYIPGPCAQVASQQFLPGFVFDHFQPWLNGNLHIGLLCLPLTPILYILIRFYFHSSTSYYWSYLTYWLFYVSAASPSDYEFHESRDSTKWVWDWTRLRQSLFP